MEYGQVLCVFYQKIKTVFICVPSYLVLVLVCMWVVRLTRMTDTPDKLPRVEGVDGELRILFQC